jgi:hypothetical protein
MTSARKALFPILVVRVLMSGFAIIILLSSAIIFGYVLIQITAILLILNAFYLLIVWIALKENVRLSYVIVKAYILEKTNKELSLRLIDSEIYDHNELLNVEKSEMDVHRYNNRDEADVARFSRRGERNIRRNLALLYRVQKILVDAMKQEPSSMYDIDLDKY